MSNARDARISILNLSHYADASGAPAVLECGGYRFACDMLGEVKLNLLASPGLGRVQGRIAAARVREHYMRAVREIAGEGWIAANRKLYSEAP